MPSKVLVLLSWSLLTLQSWATQEKLESVYQDYRLPKHVTPLQYYLELEPNFPDKVFNGSVTIELKVLEQSDNITLHGKELTIDNSSISLFSEQQQIGVEKTTQIEDDRHFYIIYFNTSLLIGATYNLSIIFTGVLNSENEGFYLAKYKVSNETERELATTQFGLTYARRAFPCFDEPHLKANFTLSIIRPENYTAISNVPVSKEGEFVTPGRFRDTFPATIQMSTYLLAFVVSDFSSTDILDIHNVYARSDEIKSGHAQYALETGEKTLKTLTEFLNTSYSLGKLSQVAIPDNYFYFSGMENWGIITYRESVLLYSNETSLRSEKQRTATIVAHEFSHQWFGDLVTPEWWKYVWLSEGFARYFEYYIVSILEPEWKIMEQFTVKVLQDAFQVDASETTRPMNTDAASPSEILALFDKIAYSKAACIIRMTETFLTTEIFRRGLAFYLDRHAYSTATPSNLYTALQQAVDEHNTRILPDALNVSNILYNWTSLAGYPLVTVAVDYSTGTVTLTQDRFTFSTHEDLWIIPINYATQHNYNFLNVSTDFWFTTKQMSFTIANLSSDTWIIFNKLERGYYRVNYNEENWNILINYLYSDNYEKLHELNRAQLIDDSFNLARSGRLSYSVPLSLSTYLKQEKSYIPLSSFFNSLDFLNTELAASDQFDKFKQYVVELLAKAYELLGTEESISDSHVDILNRADLLTWLCKYGHSECRAKSIESFEIWRNSREIIQPNLQVPFFCGAMIEASQEDWNFLYYEYQEATQTNLKVRILNGLGCSENTTILERYLNEAINTSSSLDLNHRATVFAAVYNAGIIGTSFLMKYVKEHLHEMNGSAIISTVLTGISSKLTTEVQLNELKTIVEEAKLNEDILQAAEENVEWCQKYVPQLEAWLISNYEESGSGTVCLSATTSIVFYFCISVIFLINKMY